MDMLKGFAGHISVTRWKTYNHKEIYCDIYFFIQSSYAETLSQEKK